MHDIEAKVSKARAGLILDQPFFGALSLRLQTKIDPSAETAWTDGKTFGYNPTWVKGLTLNQVKGLWAHEVMHCALGHHVRRGARDNQKWNLATDQAINHILTANNFELPTKPALDNRFKDKGAEEIYSLLGDKKPDPQGQNKKPGPGPGQEDPGACGAVRDAQGDQGEALGPAEQDAAAADWKVALNQAAQMAKACGNLPSDIARLVDEIVHPKAPWQDLLRQHVELTARNDYAWTPPNRRYLQQGFYLPSLRSEELPALVVVVDTSGSVSQEDLTQYAAEISDILEHYDTEITVIYCDTHIAGNPETFTREDMPIRLQARGGGGTDFRPPFKWVADQGLEPALLIYLTDLDCERFPSDPGYPVIWGKIGRWGRNSAPFGEVVEID